MKDFRALRPQPQQPEPNFDNNPKPSQDQWPTKDEGKVNAFYGVTIFHEPIMQITAVHGNTSD
jgi:hypothetical protein